MKTIGRTALVAVGLLTLLLIAQRIRELASNEPPSVRLLLQATERTAAGQEVRWEFGICDMTTMFFEGRLSSLDKMWAKIAARRGPLSIVATNQEDNSTWHFTIDAGAAISPSIAVD